MVMEHKLNIDWAHLQNERKTTRRVAWCHRRLVWYGITPIDRAGSNSHYLPPGCVLLEHQWTIEHRLWNGWMDFM